MVREQALQIGALRIQQAYRGRVQAAELQRIRHVCEVLPLLRSLLILIRTGWCARRSGRGVVGGGGVVAFHY